MVVRNKKLLVGHSLYISIPPAPAPKRSSVPADIDVITFWRFRHNQRNARLKSSELASVTCSTLRPSNSPIIWYSDIAEVGSPYSAGLRELLRGNSWSPEPPWSVKPDAHLSWIGLWTNILVNYYLGFGLSIKTLHIADSGRLAYSCNYLDKLNDHRVEPCQKLPSKFVVVFPRIIVSYEIQRRAKVSLFVDDALLVMHHATSNITSKIGRFQP